MNCSQCRTAARPITPYNAQCGPPQQAYGYPQAPPIPYANFGERLIALITGEFLAFSAAGVVRGAFVVQK